MARHQRRTGFAAFLSLLAFIAFTNAREFTFCAKVSPSSSPTYAQFQTNGLCFDNCNAKGFAWAVTNFQNCWCTNDAANQSDKVSSSSCSQTCPGYPDELCGGSNVYSWIQIKGPGQSPGVTSTPPSSSTSSSRRPPPPSSSPSDSTAPSPSSSSSTSSPKTSKVATTDTNGVVTTVVVTFYPSATSDPLTGGSNGGGLGTGGIVGIVIGIIGAILVIAGIILFMFMRRRKQRKEAEDAAGSASGSRHGRGSPSSPGSAGNRSSMLQIDPRMDPFNQGLYARSGSAESVNTLHDDHDYSRRIQAPKVLRATNPDPETTGAPAVAAS